MKVSELRAALEHMRPDDEVVVPVEVMGGAVGGHPFLSVKGAYVGFDWDRGRVFITPESPVHKAGEGYAHEQKYTHDHGETLAFIWMNVTSKSLDQAQKLNAVRATLRRFGFTSGLDDSNPAKKGEAK